MRSCYTNTFSFVFVFVFFTFYYEICIFDECEHFVAYSEEYHKTTLTKKQMTQIFLMKALQEALRAHFHGPFVPVPFYLYTLRDFLSPFINS